MRSRPARALWAIACVLAAGLPAPLFAADNAAVKERVRQTLLYGIDSQVLDAIQTLRSTQDSSFTPDLAKILSDPQRSDDVQKAVLDLFKDSKIRDGEERAKAILAGWQQAPEALLISDVQYLSAIQSAGLAASLQPLVDAESTAVSLAAIQAVGDTGDHASAAFLVGKLKSPDFPDGRKNQVVLALGALKDPVAVDELTALAGSTDEEKVRRMYAADSLGKIGDPKALPVLRSMFAENDALIRLYSAGALAKFNLDEVFPSLLQGLRDDDAKVREQSAKALGRSLGPAQADQAVPILSYKAEFDPQAIVRTASIKSLGAIGGSAARDTLRRIYASADRPLDSREAALGILVQQDLPGTMESIRSVVDTTWVTFDPRPLEMTARVLSTVRGAQLRDLFVRFLDSKDPTVRSYGARGIAENGFSDLKDRLKTMSEQDPNPGTKAEAARALQKL